MDYKDAIALFDACYKRSETSGHDMWKAITDHIANSVPFKVLQERCDRYKCEFWCDAKGCFCTTKQDCPLQEVK